MRYIFFLLLLPVCTFSQQPQFNASGLLCLSDGDSDFNNLADLNLKNEHFSDDQLHVIRFPITNSASKYLSSLNISNSIFSHSTIVEVTSTKPKLAFVLETRGVATETKLQSGGFISVLDISSLTLPKPLFRFPVASNPMSIALSPNNEYIAVSSEEIDNEIQVIEINLEGKPVRKIKKPTTLGNDRISHLCWTPDGEYLVYTNDTKKEVGLISVMRDPPTQKIIRLKQIGLPVKLGLQPGFGKFTPDGKYYIATDLKQSHSSTGDLNPAEIFVVRFNYESGGQHYLLSKQAVGYNLESFVVHPNGNTIIALSSENSFKANVTLNDKNAGKLHLLNVNDSGVISEIASYNIKGKYPSGLAIDKNGENIIVSVSEYDTFGIKIGGLQFWKYKVSPKKSLEKQPVDFNLPRGVHYITPIY